MNNRSAWCLALLAAICAAGVLNLTSVPLSAEEPNDEVRARLQAMEQRIKDLTAEGKTEEAEQLQRELRAASEPPTQEQPEQLRRPEPPGGRPERNRRPEGPRDQVRPLGPRALAQPQGPEQRLMHLQEAAEHLRAADMPELAQQVMEQAERLRQVLSQRPPDPQGPRDPRVGPGPQGPENLERRVEELSQSVQQMRQQLEEIQRSLREPRGGERPAAPPPSR